MSTADDLDIASGDETITGDSLQPSIDALLAMAKGLSDDIAAAPDFESVQEIGRAQAELNDQAMALVTAQIVSLAGEVRISADHINAATTFAQDVVKQMTDWRKKVATAGHIVDFFGVVLTGNGAKILEAAIKLKGAL